MKRIAAFLVLAGLLFTGVAGIAQTSQYRTKVIGTTSDTVIDSIQVAPHQRLYIDGLYVWYDNAANTNQIKVEIIEGMTAMAVQGFNGRLYRHEEAMTSAGIKGLNLNPINIMTTRDSTVYLNVAATGSDSLLVTYTYTFVAD